MELWGHDYYGYKHILYMKNSIYNHLGIHKHEFHLNTIIIQQGEIAFEGFQKHVEFSEKLEEEKQKILKIINTEGYDILFWYAIQMANPNYV
jgi:hypothetical protein